ncbi:MAG: ATP-binding cassette domain-containing protein [Candidatus Bathyarchaeota archaeon]|nr:MAG: ATP-binding cassette domain-containing protein [Candidatus Bathyarchaeota archaeon]
MSPAIEVRNLFYSYPGAEKHTLENINLVIERGDFVVLTGPSGCGKTTLCRCLNGLIPHFYGGKFNGTVIVDGLSVKDHPISALAQHVGFVFQNPENQLFALSVEKDIAFGLENLALPRAEIIKRVKWAMKITGVTELRENAPHELSGGQQQRVAIASVLAMNPHVMVLDEPTSFLDPMSSKQLFEVIQTLNKETRLTIILVEHRLDLLSPYAKRIIVMDEGKIIADGSPRSILSSKKVFSLGVGIPKVTRLYQLLLENGVSLDSPPISVKELERELRRRII